MTRQLPAINSRDFGRVIVSGDPHVFHCNVYNYWLQKTLLLDPSLGMEERMVDIAAALSYATVADGAKELGLDTPEARLKLAGDLFSQFGFGTIDWGASDDNGGNVTFPTSHYGQTFNSVIEGDEFARHQNIFDRGYAAGALAAAYGLPSGSFAATTDACHSMGDARGEVTISRREPPANMPASVSEGVGSGEAPPPPCGDTNVNEAAILEALSGLDFSGNEEGMIPRFGVMLTLHWANYYDGISFAFVEELEKKGTIDLAETLLVDAGHRCAFNTFGGIMTSAEWDAVIKPQCKTREDWVHGMVATVNALGWGTWRVAELTPDRIVVRIYDDYESRGYRGLHGEGKRPVAYLAQGGVAGLMNLIYLGDISEKPDRDMAYYEKIFNDPKTYRGRQSECMATGAPYTEIIAERAS